MRHSKTAPTSTRQRIIASAAELFHRQGLHATSVDAILAHADAGKGQFYHYFKSKDELIHAVVEDFYQRLCKKELPLRYDIDTWDDLAAFFDVFIGIQKSTNCERGCPMATIGYELTKEQELIRQDIHLTFEYTKNILVGFFQRMQARGDLRSDVEPVELADFCYSIMQGGLITAKIKKSTISFEHSVAHTIRYLKSLSC